MRRRASTAKAGPQGAAMFSFLCLLIFSLLSAGAPAAAQTAADAYYDPAEMAAARHHLTHHHGRETFWFFEAERLEYRARGGENEFHWDAQGWGGGDLNRFRMKTEGHAPLSGGDVEGEAQGLYSRAVTRFFDVQAGVRRDFGAGPNRTYAVFGVQGLAPYLFELDAAIFVSGHGEATARIEAEYELLLTQRLILQPRTELLFSAQDVAELGLGSGLASAALGARLRYEIIREVAPYVGVEWSRKAGGTADYARAAGEEPSSVFFVAGVRLWF